MMTSHILSNGFPFKNNKHFKNIIIQNAISIKSHMNKIYVVIIISVVEYSFLSRLHSYDAH